MTYLAKITLWASLSSLSVFAMDVSSQNQEAPAEEDDGTSWGDLPPEIIEKIYKRVPVIPRQQGRQVDKQSKEIIDSLQEKSTYKDELSIAKGQYTCPKKITNNITQNDKIMQINLKKAMDGDKLWYDDFFAEGKSSGMFFKGRYGKKKFGDQRDEIIPEMIPDEELSKAKLRLIRVFKVVYEDLKSYHMECDYEFESGDYYLKLRHFSDKLIEAQTCEVIGKTPFQGNVGDESVYYHCKGVDDCILKCRN